MDNATKDNVDVVAERQEERFINDILQESADMKTLQRETPYLASIEKQSMNELATGRPEMNTKLGDARWEMCVKKWQLWEGCEEEALGSAVQTVLTHLDAPHLLPSLINQQLEEGNVAASFSYLTLMTNLAEPTEK